MNRNYDRRLGFMAFFLFIAFIMPAYGENYVSKDVPPDDVLIRAIPSVTGGGPTIKIIGKFQESDKKYSVFYIQDGSTRRGQGDGLSLIRLDTNIWILGPSIIVQK